MAEVWQVHSPKVVAKRSIPKRVINPLLTTRGELSALLLLQEIETLQASKNSIALEKARDLVLKSFANNIHVYTPSLGVIDEDIIPIISRLVNAKSQVQPATTFSFDRTKLSKIRGFDPEDAVIREVDCNQFIRIVEELGPAGDVFQRRIELPGYDDCLKLNSYVEELNKFISKGSPHLLYNFVSNPNSSTQTVAFKALSHRNVVASIGNIVGIDYQNMAQWISNGIRLANINEGIEPLSPQESIEGLIQRATEQDRIGEPLTAAVLITIIKVVTAAIAATTLLVAAIKRNPTSNQVEPLDRQFPGIGQAPFGPQWQTDFVGLQPGGTGTNSGSGSANSNSNTGLIIGAGALALLAFSK